jgi:chorismate mutase
MTGETPLENFRRELDRIDDTIQDLLIERAGINERIREHKKANDLQTLNPAREAEILRRLIARHHGRFPKAVIVRIWREILGAMVGLQEPLSVAVYMPGRGSGYIELARDHYGAYTLMTPARSPGQVVRMVTEGSATVGIVPMPNDDDSEPWWVNQMGDSPSLARIISRLPFSGPGPGRGGGLEALAIARFNSPPTGLDRSWIALETSSDVSRGRIRSILGATGLEPTLLAATNKGEAVWRHLIELSGHVSADDRRVARLVERNQPITQATIIGGYPVPISPEEIAD